MYKVTGIYIEIYRMTEIQGLLLPHGAGVRDVQRMETPKGREEKVEPHKFSTGGALHPSWSH